MLTVATVNVNGIRAAVKQRSEENLGFLAWWEQAGVDVVLLQEVRASEKQAREALAPVLDAGWCADFAPAAQKGRSGVAILSRLPLKDINIGLPGFETVGRWIEATVTTDAGTDVRVASLYLPSGGEGDPQVEKYSFLDSLGPVMADRAREYENMVVAGDWNICHRREDLRNWRTNRKRAGFLPDERAFMDSLFGPGPQGESQINDATEAPRPTILDDGRRAGVAGAVGEFYAAKGYKPGTYSLRSAAENPCWVDVQRSLHPEEEGPFSWYTWRGKAFDTGAGWRIDIHAATQALAKTAQWARTDTAESYDLRWSDHSPVIVAYDI